MNGLPAHAQPISYSYFGVPLDTTDGPPSPAHANVAGLLNLALGFGHKSEACWEPGTLSTGFCSKSKRENKQIQKGFGVCYLRCHGISCEFTGLPLILPMPFLSLHTEVRVLRSEPSTDGREQCWNWRAWSPGQWHGVRGMCNCFSVASARHFGLEVSGCRK